MALELLAGPYKVTPVSSGTTVPSGSGVTIFYTDDLGLVMTPGGTTDQGGVIQLDGSFCQYACHSLSKVGLDLSVIDAPKPYTVYAGYLSHVDPVTLRRGEPFISTGDSTFWLRPTVRLGDRYLQSTGNGVIQSKNINLTQSWVTESSISIPYAGDTYTVVSMCTPSLGRGDTVYFPIRNGAVEYDFSAREVLRVLYIDKDLLDHVGLWYSKKLDVFISLHGTFDRYIRVWANAVRPYQISSPTPTTSVRKGKVSSYKVQVLGSYGEACEGEMVDWAVTGEGSLLSTQSITDINGYAEVQYVAPLSLPGSPPVISAELRF